MTLIDGKAVSRKVLEECRADIAAMKAQGVVPGLAVVIVGDDPASQAYVGSKVRTCGDLGLFSRHIALLSAATEQVVNLIKTLRGLGSGQVAKAKECNQRLQQIEGDADKLILEILKDLYSGAHDPIKVLALRDLYELLETVVDRCRDAGIVVMHIVLKNS
jgi:hypothetical protein